VPLAALGAVPGAGPGAVAGVVAGAGPVAADATVVPLAAVVDEDGDPGRDVAAGGTTTGTVTAAAGLAVDGDVVCAAPGLGVDSGAFCPGGGTAA